jgi:DnaJ-class molecular chaperone
MPLTDPKTNEKYTYDGPEDDSTKWRRVPVKRCMRCNGSGFDAGESPPYDCSPCGGSGWTTC